jgi:putative zinc finger/helix-turn-helix YgiT family protein
VSNAWVAAKTPNGARQKNDNWVIPNELGNELGIIVHSPIKSIVCPKGHGSMKIKNTLKETKFRGIDITLPVETYVCPECGFEAATIESTGAIQTALADAYRAKKGLLTGEEIKSMRKARRLSQQDLAKLMDIGIASIKRWETGLIQSKSMDLILLSQLSTC